MIAMHAHTTILLKISAPIQCHKKITETFKSNKNNNAITFQNMYFWPQFFSHPTTQNSQQCMHV